MLAQAAVQWPGRIRVGTPEPHIKKTHINIHWFYDEIWCIVLGKRITLTGILAKLSRIRVTCQRRKLHVARRGRISVTNQMRPMHACNALLPLPTPHKGRRGPPISISSEACVPEAANRVVAIYVDILLSRQRTACVPQI